MMMREEFHHLDLPVALFSRRRAQHNIVAAGDDVRLKRRGQRKEGERENTDP